MRKACALQCRAREAGAGFQHQTLWFSTPLHTHVVLLDAVIQWGYETLSCLPVEDLGTDQADREARLKGTIEEQHGSAMRDLYSRVLGQDYKTLSPKLLWGWTAYASWFRDQHRLVPT